MIWLDMVMDTLMSKNTLHREALLELKKLEGRFDISLKNVELYRSFEETLGVTPANIP